WGGRAGRWLASSGLPAGPSPLPTGQLEPGRTTLFADSSLVKAWNALGDEPLAAYAVGAGSAASFGRNLLRRPGLPVVGAATAAGQAARAARRRASRSRSPRHPRRARPRPRRPPAQVRPHPVSQGRRTRRPPGDTPRRGP